MSFTLPTFNLMCNIYTPPFTGGPPRVAVACNLAWSRRISMPSGQALVGVEPMVMTLLLPAGTDIRVGAQGVAFDIVEVPAGTGRWYNVLQVDDIGKGFLNEHRAALLGKLANTEGVPNWPIPMP